MSALRQLKRRIKEIEYSYSEKRRQLEQENAASEKFQQLEFSMVSAIQEIENQIDWIESNRLSRKARSLDVVVPPLSDAGMWRREEFGPKIWLTQEGRAHVRNLIHEERKRRFEDMSRWIPLLSVILAIIGTLTSLVALTLQRKSADAATMAAGNTRIALETAANQLEAWKNSQSAQLVVEKFDAKLIPMRTYVFGQTITNPKELEIQVVLTIKNVGPSVAKEIFITKNGGSFDAKTVPIQYPQWRWHPPMPFVGGAKPDRRRIVHVQAGTSSCRCGRYFPCREQEDLLHDWNQLSRHVRASARNHGMQILGSNDLQCTLDGVRLDSEPTKTIAL